MAVLSLDLKERTAKVVNIATLDIVAMPVTSLGRPVPTKEVPVGLRRRLQRCSSQGTFAIFFIFVHL